MFYNVGIIPRLNQAFGNDNNQPVLPKDVSRRDLIFDDPLLHDSYEPINWGKMEKNEWNNSQKNIKKINEIIKDSRFQTDKEAPAFDLADFKRKDIKEVLKSCDDKLKSGDTNGAMDDYTNTLWRLNTTMLDLPNIKKADGVKNNIFKYLTTYMAQSLFGLADCLVAKGEEFVNDAFKLRLKLMEETNIEAF